MDQSNRSKKKLRMHTFVEKDGFLVRDTVPACVDVYSERNPSFLLIEAGDVPAPYRWQTDVIYDFYAGDPVEMLFVSAAGRVVEVRLGIGGAGRQSRLKVPAGTWRGTRIKNGGSWALIGLSAAATFDPHAYEVGTVAKLRRESGKSDQLISRLTRPRKHPRSVR